MLKKTILSFFILLVLFINTNICKAETSKDLNDTSINVTINNDLFKEIKRYYNDNIAVHLNWFKDNVKPKIENVFNKITSAEEFSKEKEEIKNELPSFIEQIFNFFKSFKN